METDRRESWDKRCVRAAQTADAKLGGKANLPLPDPPKPKWMRWPTYHRLCMEREDAILRSLGAAFAALGMQHLVDRIAPPPLDADKEN